MKKIIFITGVDTGAGKTVLTAMLLAFLRGAGGRALAMKPFCSGPRDDALLLHSLQKECLTLNDVNPFYFDKPLAPAAALGPSNPPVPLAVALRQIRNLATRCDLLVVEGAGGLLAPLGAKFTVRDMIRRLNCKVIVVCLNRIGVINHALLTAEALQRAEIKEFAIVMMGMKKPDISAASNLRMIEQRLPSVPIFCLPYLGNRASTGPGAKKNAKKLKKTLAAVVGNGILHMFFNRTKRLFDKTC